MTIETRSKEMDQMYDLIEKCAVFFFEAILRGENYRCAVQKKAKMCIFKK